MAYNHKIQIAIADDHAMLRKGIVKLLTYLGNYEIIFEALSGSEVQGHLKKHMIPDVLILDINMSGKEDGIATAKWVSTNYPQVRILALSMYQDEDIILKMIEAGAHGYVTKSSEPEKLKEAIDNIYEKGVFLPESLSAQLFSGIRNQKKNELFGSLVLSEKEKLFLSLLCKELTYEEIGKKMFLSPRTIDDYRKRLSKKLGVKGKSGLIVYAMNNGIG